MNRLELVLRFVLYFLLVLWVVSYCYVVRMINKKIKLEEKKQADDYALKKALIESKRADNFELMSDYYSRKDKHFREKMDKLDKLDMIDKLDNSDIKEFIKDLVNEHFKNLDDGK